MYVQDVIKRCLLKIMYFCCYTMKYVQGIYIIMEIKLKRLIKTKFWICDYIFQLYWKFVFGRITKQFWPMDWCCPSV